MDNIANTSVPISQKKKKKGDILSDCFRLLFSFEEVNHDN